MKKLFQHSKFLFLEKVLNKIRKLKKLGALSESD